MSERPHLPEDTIKFLEKALIVKKSVLEIGAGDSTVWFAQRATKVISVEHDAVFYAAVTEKCEKLGLKNVRLILKDINKEKIGLRNLFDVALVDNKGDRTKAMEFAMRRLKPGGLVVLDDVNWKISAGARKLVEEAEWSVVATHQGEVRKTTIWRKPMKAPKDMKIYKKPIPKGQEIKLRPYPWTSSHHERLIKFLESVVTKRSVVVEFGSGGSTLWLAQHAKNVVAFEHDPFWQRVVMEHLKKRRKKNTKVILMEDYPDRKIFRHLFTRQADFVYVDGINRVRCVQMIMRRIKPGGWIYVQDYNNTPSVRIRRTLGGAGWKKQVIIPESRAAWRKPE